MRINILSILFLMLGCSASPIRDNDTKYPVDSYGAVCTNDEQCGRKMICDKRGNYYGKCVYFYDQYKTVM